MAFSKDHDFSKDEEHGYASLGYRIRLVLQELEYTFSGSGFSKRWLIFQWMMDDGVFKGLASI